MPLNALNLMYCKVHVAQIIIIEDIDNIIKGALEVFLSVFLFMQLIGGLLEPWKHLPEHFEFLTCGHWKHLEKIMFGKVLTKNYFMCFKYIVFLSHKSC